MACVACVEFEAKRDGEMWFLLGCSYKIGADFILIQMPPRMPSTELKSQEIQHMNYHITTTGSVPRRSQ